jgi:hypothetical protein
MAEHGDRAGATLSVQSPLRFMKGDRLMRLQPGSGKVVVGGEATAALAAAHRRTGAPAHRRKRAADG